jgi:Septum formation
MVTRQQAPWADQAIVQDAPADQRARSGNSHRRALALAGVGLVVLAAVIVAIVAVTSSVSSARRLTERQLRSGDCVRGSNLGLDTNGPWPGVVTVVPCTQQHLAEVFFAGNVWPQSLAYPGDGKVNRQANKRCDAALDVYVGRPQHDPVTFTDRAVLPGNAAWLSGDRLVLCAAYEANFQPVNYSIKGSNG